MINNFSLLFKLLLVTVVPTILVFIMILFNMKTNLLDYIQKETVSNIQLSSEAIQDKIEQKLKSIEDKLRFLMYVVQPNSYNTAETSMQYGKILNETIYFNSFSVYNIQGQEQFKVPNSTLEQDKLYFHEKFFTSPLLNNKAYYGDMKRNKETAQYEFKLSLNTISQTTGEINGVLCSVVNIYPILEILFENLSKYDGVVLYDEISKSVIYQAKKAKLFTIDELISSDKKIDILMQKDQQFSVIRNSIKISDLELKLVFLQSNSKLYHLVNELTTESFIKEIIYLGLLTFGLIIVLRILLKPLQNVTKKIKELAIYYSGSNVEIIKTNNEIDDLKGSFEILQNAYKEYELKLQILNETLEDRVTLEVDKNRKKDDLLNHQSKMAAMGEMIGNIAHQWRQPLSTISTIASGVQVQKEFGKMDDEELDVMMNSIIGTVNHLSHTIDDFRNFFKANKEVKTFNVSNTLTNALKLIDSAFKNNDIRVILNLDEKIEYNGYENELIQAILNILNNAKDALKEKNIENKLIVVNITQNEKEVIISIKDNAGGIPKDIIDKIFDPYFTTKGDKDGTGIGLYMTYKIVVEHHKGKLEVKNSEFEFENQKYIGAEFLIIFYI